MRRALVKAIATFFFIGEVVPVAPGTAGSFAALLLYLALPPQGAVTFLVFAGVTALGVWAAGAAEKVFGRKDPHQVVIDEVAGLFFVYWGLPWDPLTLVAGFVLYRLMDVIKPFPARRLEHLPGGWGIMLDDLVAGLYAQGLVRLGYGLKFLLVRASGF